MNELKTYIDNRLSDIKTNSRLNETIINKTINNGTNNEKQYLHFSVKKLVLTVSVICLVFAASVTAFASAVPMFNDWIYSISPKLAELLYPVNESAEDQGIKIDVLYAGNDNHNAVVYFTVQDITGMNRVDEDLDLCDTCNIDGPCAFNVEMLSFDEKTNTAFFIMRGLGGEGMSNRLANFKIGKIQSDKITHDWYHTGVDMESLIVNKVKSFPVSEYFYTGGSEQPENGLFVLEPDVMNVSFGDDIDFVTISNIGFVDGKLHIQTKWDASFDNHGQLVLLDKNKTSFDDENAILFDNYYFKTEEDSENCSKDKFAHHIEYVFDINSLEELSSYELWGNFVEDGSFIEGEWNVDFRLSDTEKMKINQTDGIADHVEVSTIGAYIKGYNGEYEQCDFSIVLKDGTVVDFSQFGSNDSYYGNPNKFDVDMMFVDSPIVLNDIASISIDGSKIYKK